MRTSFTDLVGCDAPIQLAAMGVVGTPELASAVIGAGGLGMLANPLSVQEVADAVASAARDNAGPLGVGFLIPFLVLEAVEEAARTVDVVEFFYGEPDPALVRIAGRHGAKVGWQTGSLAEARAAAEAGCSYIVVQGIEAGGHIRGTQRLDELLAEAVSTFDMPIVAAGGIGTAGRVSDVIEAGAAAVRVGTRFLAAPECAAHPLYVEALIRAGARDTVVTRAFGAEWPNASHRVLKTSLNHAERSTREVVASLGDLRIARFSAIPPHRDAQGDVLALAAYAGESVDAVNGIEPARAIVADLMSEL